MKKIYLISLLSFFVINILAAQPYINIQISNQASPEEVSISINPRNVNQIVGGANLNSYYYSSNGGFNWTRGVLTSSAYGVWGDPCVVVDTSGHFYYFHLSNTPAPGHWIDRIVCQKSTNAGVNWNNPGSFTFFDPNKDQDKEWACVDWSGGTRGNWIYCTWTQFDNYGSSSQLDSTNILFARSTNGGDNWTGVTRINQLGGDCIDDDNTVEGAVPCVGPNGEVYVSWAGPKIRNSQFGIFFDRSTDGGDTWMANDVYVVDQPGGWAISIPGIYRCNGMPVTCCDISSGPFRGTIYINYTDLAAGNSDCDVKLVKSTNGGLNWSEPMRVNYDLPGKHQFFTWMTIDQVTGYLYFVFYDRRNYLDNQTDVYLARSTNGGSTFSNIRVNETPFLPTSGTFFGDYNNITAHNGIIRPMWTRLHTGQLSVWTAIIDFPTKVEGPRKNSPNRFNLSQNYPNPFNPSTTVKFDVPLTPYSRLEEGQSGVMVRLIVYDILGKEIASLVNEQLSPGTYEIKWNAVNLPGGVYFYKLFAGSFSDTKKMILLK
jgi:hypothetical protein